MKITNYFLRFFFLFPVGLVLPVELAAQDALPEPPRPQVLPQPQSPFLRMSPPQLLRLRSQLTFELQQTQRTLGFIDTNDAQLAATLKEQQAELVNQLKEINTQLKNQGIPLGSEEPATAALPDPKIPTTPRAGDPTLVSGGIPQMPADSKADPNLLIQQRPVFGGIQPPIPTAADSPTTLPIPFDQGQVWANSPWIPQPSKELTELKQTVDSLRKDVSDLKESIKALETQIQLLNRNILLSQPLPK